MSIFAGLALIGSSTLVTCVELSYRNQRHPFGDKHFKAVLWWAATVVIDAAVGLAVFVGVVTVKLTDQADIKAASGISLAVTIGVLGPLALRSPVKNSNISNKEAGVGITYVYDLVRLNALFALDERFVRLKRRDVMNRRERWQAQGINIEEILEELNRHIDDHTRMSADRREQIRENIRNVLTVPDEDVQMNGLIKLMKAERFNSLIDEFDERVVPTTSVPPPGDIDSSSEEIIQSNTR